MFRTVVLASALALGYVAAQSSSSVDSYVGYNLTLQGDQDSVVFSTDETRPDVSNEINPDVYLNATVHVTEIDLRVDNLTAKINLDAQVLSLLKFNAGVDLSIDAVTLLIQNVNAKVLLEARLQNLVLMINDTLSSLDLNPALATLGQGVGNLLNPTTGVLNSTLSSTASSLGARSLSLQLASNILYSTNNYLGNTHTNRVLAQNGDVVDEYLDNNGHSQGQQVIGNYESLMTFNGIDLTVEKNGQSVHEREYTYSPYHGINAISAIYTDGTGNVVGTQVLAESFAGGSSTIEDL